MSSIGLFLAKPKLACPYRMGLRGFHNRRRRRGMAELNVRRDGISATATANATIWLDSSMATPAFQPGFAFQVLWRAIHAIISRHCKWMDTQWAQGSEVSGKAGGSVQGRPSKPDSRVPAATAVPRMNVTRLRVSVNA